MKFAFCLFKYYQYGGLSRDLVRIINLCKKRGHTIDIFTMQWDGEIPENCNVNIIKAKGLTNHRRAANFAKQVLTINSKNYDAIVGFNRMPGLDLYYICDVCFKHSAAQKHGAWYHLTNRYKTYIKLEQAVFSPKSTTQILYKTEMLKQQYLKYYQTPANRFHLINPGIDPTRKAPQNADIIRAKIRKDHHITDDQNLILLIGSNFKLKGVDRALLAIAALPEQTRQKTILWIIGKGKERPFKRMTKKLGITSTVNFLGTKDNVSEILLAGDLLIHPAYQDATGGILLEALAAGLPVLTTDTCGFAPYIQKAEAGYVIPSPFRQKTLNDFLQKMLMSKQKLQWKKNALLYCENHPNIFDSSDMIDFIEKNSR